MNIPGDIQGKHALLAVSRTHLAAGEGAGVTHRPVYSTHGLSS